MASYRKSQWQLEDYPVRVVRQAEVSTPQLPAWRAQIIGWWLSGLGGSPEEALANLSANLETQRARKPLPRPGTKPPVEFASASELDRHGEFAYEFIERVVGIRPFFMSDGTHLLDFCGTEEMPEVHRKVALLYGADSRSLEDQPLWRVLDHVRAAGGRMTSG